MFPLLNSNKYILAGFWNPLHLQQIPRTAPNIFLVNIFQLNWPSKLVSPAEYHLHFTKQATQVTKLNTEWATTDGLHRATWHWWEFYWGNEKDHPHNSNSTKSPIFSYVFHRKTFEVILEVTGTYTKWARNFQFRPLDTNWEFLSFGAEGFGNLLWRAPMGFGAKPQKILAI